MSGQKLFSWFVLCIIPLAVWCGNEDSGSKNKVAVPDEQGYILFCPCMGRFGNQMDYFLGSLGFAKALNRTLVLAPWVEFRHGPKSTQVPFDEYFQVDGVAKYHRVITMETFMSDIAPTLWPPSKRISFCYQTRQGYEAPATDPCASKNGNPPGPFWDTYQVDFVDSELHAPLLYDVWNVDGEAQRWQARYPPQQWPVLAFAGSPASFPVLRQNAHLQQFFHWSEAVLRRADVIRARLPRGPFVGIHLRMGVDWERACKHVKDTRGNLFSSAQCLGYRGENGSLSHELCLPSWTTIVRQVRRAVRQVRAVAVYVATDAAEKVAELKRALGKTDLEIVSWSQDWDGTEADPHAELALLARSNFFLGNCVSSFTAVAKRERDSLGLPSGFWGFPPEPERKRREKRDEL